MAARQMRACPQPNAARGRFAMSAIEHDPADDIDRIMRVMERAFAPEYGEAWNRRQISDSLVLGGTHYSLIMADGSISSARDQPVAGFALTRGLFDEEELLLFAIEPEFRRQGLAHALLVHVIAQARARGVRRLFLEMRKDNPVGHLYAAHGFRTVGIRPRYYRTASGDRLDAISQELLIG
jgi:ribosomal-protein-alanine N-acetyltransferase